jgi:uncharacterized OB-fold protein
MDRLFVKSDKSGEILAIVKVETLPQGRKTPFDDEDDASVAVIEVKPSIVKSTFRDMEVVDIHVGYVVDTKTKALKKKKA